MENTDQNILEIKVKAIFLGEFHDRNSRLKHTQKVHNIYGVTQQLFHQDCNGFTTSGYYLRNTQTESVYPVKSYLLASDPAAPKPLKFKSPSNN